MGHFNNQFLFHSLTSLSLPKQCTLSRSKVMSRKLFEKMWILPIFAILTIWGSVPVPLPVRLNDIINDAMTERKRHVWLVIQSTKKSCWKSWDDSQRFVQDASSQEDKLHRMSECLFVGVRVHVVLGFAHRNIASQHRSKCLRDHSARFEGFQVFVCKFRCPQRCIDPKTRRQSTKTYAWCEP